MGGDKQSLSIFIIKYVIYKVKDIYITRYKNECNWANQEVRKTV